MEDLSDPSRSRSRKPTLTTIAILTLVALAAVQSYSLIMMARAGTQNVVGVAPNPGTQNTITVLGTGHASLKPDTAIVSIGVTTQAPTVQSAVQQNADLMNSVISALNGIGITSDNIQTSYYNVSPTYTSTNPPSITGYQVNNQLQVTILSSSQDVKQLGTKAGQAIDTAVASGANQLNGVQFTASQSLYLQTQQTALQDASKDATNQAHVIAAAMGVKITGLVSVGLSNNYYPPVFTAGVSSSTPIVAPQSLQVTAVIEAVYGIA